MEGPYISMNRGAPLQDSTKRTPQGRRKIARQAPKMEDLKGFRRFANPLLLNLQKMELELTCPICLKLLTTPMLFPCNHICCSDCVTAVSRNGYDCSVCKMQFCEQDLRPAAYVEAMISIYKNMSSTLNAFFKQQSSKVDSYDTKIASGGTPVSGNGKPREKLGAGVASKMAKYKGKHINPCPLQDGVANIGKSKNERSVHENIVTQNEKIMHNANLEDQLVQKESCSPESFSESDDSYLDSNDAGSEPRTKRSSPETLSRRESNFTASQGADNHEREPKKLKMDNVAAACIQTTDKCAFCHTSKTTEASGPLLHYLDGKEMFDNEANQPDVLHVHQKCIEWAPQAFFAGDTPVNVEAELVRSSKIKCTSCGLKGAALGCYVKNCRRSYHVPCAAEITGCRWDYDNFLLLCPFHSSNKLPCDRSRNKRKSLDVRPASFADSHTDMVDQPSSPKQCHQRIWTGPSSVTREWLLCGSGLSNKEKNVIDEFISLTGVAMTSVWNPNATHVVAATDENGACARTLKLLMAILAGKWVLSIDWLKACMEAGCPVPEDPYEVTHDIHGSFDGPRTGRTRAMKKEPKLFAGLTFCFLGSFMPNYKGHLENLVLAAGGTLLDKGEILPSTFVVYSADPPQGSDPKLLNDAIEKRKEEAQDFAAQTCSTVVAHTWLLDTIAACSLPQAL